MASLPDRPDHAALMDRVYRWQRPIYDLTRKYFLFGRDRLIREMDARPGNAVLELGCGTGRNLALIARAWPGVRCHGLDISAQMLKAARRMAGRGTLALGDATRFDAPALFGREGFDHVVLSYALSMIPDWQAALEQAVSALAPDGTLHVVDFADAAGLPRPARAALGAWLGRFHVTPRTDLAMSVARLGRERGLRITVKRGALGYYQIVRLSR